jgi:TRAP transporter TAXI family solute receptor
MTSRTRPAYSIYAICLAALLALTACGGNRGSEAGGDGCGKLSIATGNTTGVYYQLGGGIANLISKNISGCEATAEATSASVENVQRVVRGDAHIAFTLADTANDAVTGTGAFTSKQPISALLRLYDNATHVVVRADTRVRKVADLRGRRVSTGSANSGTEVIALRLLKAAGLNPDGDVKRQALGLPETVDAMKDGTIDALFWSGGLPTAGITDLMVTGKGKFVLLPLDDLLPALQQAHGRVYSASTIAKTVYQTPADIRTINVPNLLIVKTGFSDRLSHDIVKLLFDQKSTLEKVHPSAKEISRTNAAMTDPVPLAPGAKRYFTTPGQ